MRKVALIIFAVLCITIPAIADAPGIEVTKLYWKCLGPIKPGSSYNWYVIAGEIVNKGGNDYERVTMEFSIIDRSDNGRKLKQSPYCTLYNIKPGDRSEFKCDDPLCSTGADIKKNRYTGRLDRIRGRIARTD